MKYMRRILGWVFNCNHAIPFEAANNADIKEWLLSEDENWERLPIRCVLCDNVVSFRMRRVVNALVLPVRGKYEEKTF